MTRTTIAALLATPPAELRGRWFRATEMQVACLAWHRAERRLVGFVIAALAAGVALGWAIRGVA